MGGGTRYDLFPTVHPPDLTSQTAYPPDLLHTLRRYCNCPTSPHTLFTVQPPGYSTPYETYSAPSKAPSSLRTFPLDYPQDPRPPSPFRGNVPPKFTGIFRVNLQIYSINLMIMGFFSTLGQFRSPKADFPSQYQN